MNRRCFMLLLVVTLCVLGWRDSIGAQQKSAGELVWAMHVTIAPSWFDPAENGGLITPFGILYALHDAVVRPMPGEKIGNSLAESWTESPDGLVYEFRLRQGLRFHDEAGHPKGFDAGELMPIPPFHEAEAGQVYVEAS